MKKFILLFLFICTNVATGADPSYFVIQKTGTESSYNIFSKENVVLPKGSTETLSATFTIPFAWRFFGESVTSYRVSDNGYVTFDVAATTSDSNNVVLPDVNAPKNTIFALWDNLELKGNPSNPNIPVEVRNFNYGSAPNRVHVIQWYMASRVGVPLTQSTMFFAVRIFEAGDFDIVFNYCKPMDTVVVNATIGVQNADGTNAIMVDGSPNLPFPNYLEESTTNITDKVFFFKWGAFSRYDLQMVSAPLPKNVGKNKSAVIKAGVLNKGMETLTSVELNYSVDGGPTQTCILDSLNIAGDGGTDTLEHTIPFIPTESGKNYSIKIWSSKLNGQDDEIVFNDTISTSIFCIEGVSAPKKVLLEEGTGGWCGFCPDGHIVLRDILKNNRNVVGAVHHNGDSMITAEGNIINTAYAFGYPYGMVDRTMFSDQADVAIDRGIWKDYVVQQLNASTPLEVSVSRSFDPVTRELSITANVKAEDYLSGDVRLNIFICEDKVRGTDLRSNYTQHNYYSHEMQSPAGGAGHELYPEPEYFVGYFHNHCVRAVLTGAWGDSTVVPATVTPNQTFSKTYNYTLPEVINVGYTSESINTKFQSTDTGPARNKADDTYIVAFLSYYNTSKLERQVLNAEEMYITEVAVKETEEKAGTEIFPNPAYGITTIKFTASGYTKADIQIYNTLGMLVQTIKSGEFAPGEHYLVFDADKLSQGMYYVSIRA
ncbi:MAG: Omp28-related outer membrane protein, partial [Bacteroidota bacterium]